MMTIRQPYVVSVRLETQEIRFQQRVKYALTHLPFNAAQTLYLLDLQPHSRHLDEFGTELVEHVFNCSHGRQPSLHVLWSACPGHTAPHTSSIAQPFLHAIGHRDGDDDGAAEISFCLEPIIQVVSVVPATLLVEFVGSTRDIMVGHGGRESIW
jgi:hypothetical protein